MPLAAFRADASHQIGLGHIMRCLVLADALTKRGWRSLFLCKNHDQHPQQLIAARGYETMLLQCDAVTDFTAAYQGWLGGATEDDALQSLALLREESVSLLVVDHYALDARWQQLLADDVGAVMVMDDLANRSHHCQLLLDPTLGRHSDEYTDQGAVATTMLLGPQYALLRPEFAMLAGNAKRKRSKGSDVDNIVISLGGSDPLDITAQCVKALSHLVLPDNLQVRVVLGKNYRFLESLEKTLKWLPYRCSLHVNVSDMENYLLEANIAIGGSGSSSWERCTLGLPTLQIVDADNQREIARNLESSGAIIAMDARAGFNRREFIEVLSRMIGDSQLRQQMSAAAFKVCDGQGTERVVSAILESVKSEQ
jgi:UDP-2,4-diacetamido-2,4,6-trideoxy-beta-L-altropyranose hydrolase